MGRVRVKSLIMLLAGLLASPLPGRSASAEAPPSELRGAAFGTSYCIKWTPLVGDPGGTDTPHIDTVSAGVRAVIEEVERQMSLWRADSELSRFNRHRSLEWFDVSQPLARVVQRAADVHRASGGAFDPTVGPLVRLWSFGPGDRPARVPSDAELQQILPHVGMRLVEVRQTPPALRKRDPLVELDLNAIAKGYGVDAVAAYLNTLSIGGSMVEIGGEVVTSGRRPDGTAWRIGIEEPARDRRAISLVVELHDAALATSGDYRSFFESEGQTYSHTINPRTGRPVEHALASASVIASDCMTADAWATALMVLGPEDAYNTAVREKLAVLLMVQQANGVSVRATPGFPATPLDSTMASGVLSTFILAAIVIALAIGGMSLGLLCSNRCLRGSCGGMRNLRDEHGHPVCDACCGSSPASDETPAADDQTLDSPRDAVSGRS
jgi:thiamine biosynthesis lipoprotein